MGRKDILGVGTKIPCIKKSVCSNFRKLYCDDTNNMHAEFKKYQKNNKNIL